MLFFFFQAEDGIRDLTVTGVQTCALPISEGYLIDDGVALGMRRLAIIDLLTGEQPTFNEDQSVAVILNGEIFNYRELPIGRASCRGRVEISVGAGSFKKKKKTLFAGICTS